MPYGSLLRISPTNLLLLTAKQEPYKKAYLLKKNVEEFSGKSLEGRTSRQKKKKDRKGNRTRQKNKRGDSKVESSDSPEIPTGGRHQTSPASLRGLHIKDVCYDTGSCDTVAAFDYIRRCQGTMGNEKGGGVLALHKQI